MVDVQIAKRINVLQPMMGELQAPLVADEEGVALLNGINMTMHQMKFFKRTALMSLGVVCECYEELNVFVASSFLCGMFLLMWLSSLFMGISRGCALV